MDEIRSNTSFQLVYVPKISGKIQSKNKICWNILKVTYNDGQLFKLIFASFADLGWRIPISLASIDARRYICIYFFSFSFLVNCCLAMLNIEHQRILFIEQNRKKKKKTKKKSSKHTSSTHPLCKCDVRLCNNENI